jgi:hypothetical protein
MEQTPASKGNTISFFFVLVFTNSYRVTPNPHSLNLFLLNFFSGDILLSSSLPTTQATKKQFLFASLEIKSKNLPTESVIRTK